MKQLIFLFLVILTYIPVYSQIQISSGQGGCYTLITKAEKLYKKNELDKAEKYLKKAEKCDFGWCGNAWADANGQIENLKALILIKKEKYDSALIVLDSIKGCSFGANCELRETIKINTLIQKYGKNEVQNSFKKINEINKVGNKYDFNFSVYLNELDYLFYFHIDSEWISDETREVALKEQIFGWKDFEILIQSTYWNSLIIE